MSQRYLDALAALRRFRGVALVADAASEEVGAALDPDLGENPAEVPFLIGSVSKVFTAALACDLFAAGRLDPMAPVGALLPELGPTRGAVLNAHQLLTHTAGIASVLRPHGAAASLVGGADTQDEVLRRLCALPPRFPPGARFEYSNSGYTLLAALLSRAAGAPFPALLAERVLRPAGLLHTAPAGPEAIAQLPPLRWLRGAGDLVSTAGDLGRLGRALLRGGLLPRMGTVTPPARAYGYGLRVATREGRRVLYHDGALPGALATLHLLPGPELVVVLLGESVGPGPGQGAFALAQLNRWADALATGRLGGRPAPPPRRVHIDEDEMARCAGVYALCGAPSRQVRVLLRDGGLLARVEGAPPFTLPGLARPPGVAGARALAFLEALAAGRTDEAFALCDEASRGESAPAALRAAWQGITGRAGPLRRAFALQEGEGVAYVRCEMALCALDLWVVFDEAGAVAAFHVQPPGSGPAAAELPLIPLGDGRFCADGHQVGAQDVSLVLRDPDTLVIRGAQSEEDSEEEHVARRVALP